MLTALRPHPSNASTSSDSISSVQNFSSCDRISLNTGIMLSTRFQLELAGSDRGSELKHDRVCSSGNRFETKAAMRASISGLIGEFPTSKVSSKLLIRCLGTWVNSGTWDASMRRPKRDKFGQYRAKATKHFSVARGGSLIRTSVPNSSAST